MSAMKLLTDAELAKVLTILHQAGLLIAVTGASDDSAIAYHEAGHAIIGRALGGCVTSVSIEDEGKAAQIEQPDHEHPDIDDQERTRRVEVVAKTLLAGPVSERRRVGSCRGWGGDVHRLGALLASHPTPPVKSGATWLTSLVNATNALANANWDDICAVANLLLKQKTITGAEMETLLSKQATGHSSRKS